MVVLIEDDHLVEGHLKSVYTANGVFIVMAAL